MTTGGSAGTWYWCVRHNRAEDGEHTCRADDRLGPYASKEAAEDWQSLVESRNDRWDEQDRAWSGEEDS